MFGGFDIIFDNREPRMDNDVMTRSEFVKIPVAINRSVYSIPSILRHSRWT